MTLSGYGARDGERQGTDMAKTNTTSTAGRAKRATGGRKGARASAKGPAGSRAFKRAEQAAKEALKDPKKARELGDEAEAKAGKHGIDLGGALGDLQTLIRLIRAYASNDYREVPTKTMVAAAAAVAYFVMPIDAIPDVIPGAGYLDDTAVLYFVVRAIRRDLDDFRTWEEHQRSPERRTRKATGAKSQVTKRRATKRAAATKTGSAGRTTNRTPGSSDGAAPRSRARTTGKRAPTTAGAAAKAASRRTTKAAATKQTGSRRSDAT
jgi:uncharacterized membrane protein YkvA (DUF1232 family)